MAQPPESVAAMVMAGTAWADAAERQVRLADMDDGRIDPDPARHRPRQQPVARGAVRHADAPRALPPVMARNVALVLLVPLLMAGGGGLWR